MNKKTDFILDSIIRAYLEEQNPIGSMLLQDSLNVPASTIRVYFRQLDDNGYISKIHASGGRIPTQKAMKYYWHHFFKNFKNSKINIKSDLELLKIASKNDLFCILIDTDEVFLENIVNVNNKYLILDFKKCNVVISFSKEINALFNEIKKCELNEIKTILYRLNLIDILKNIENALNYKIKFIYGEKTFANIIKLTSFNSLFNVRLLDYFTDNLIFDELFLPDYMGVKINCKSEHGNTALVLAGSIFTDYEDVINQIKEVV